MKIVTVTAEPQANYHFQDFPEHLVQGITHLVPDNTRIQGKSFLPTTDDLNILNDADLLVVEGGDFTDWTTRIAFLANSLNIPVVLTELAYNSAIPSENPLPELIGVSANSPYGAENYRKYLGGREDIVITGHTMLDSLPKWEPIDKTVLCLSSESLVDDGVALKESIALLEAEGYKVTVRCHPREDKTLWKGYNLSDGSKLLDELATTNFVIGVAGTAFSAVLAMGIPTVIIKESTADNVLPEYRNIFTYASSKDIVKMIATVKPYHKEDIAYITGTIGNACETIVSFWKSFI